MPTYHDQPSGYMTSRDAWAGVALWVIPEIVILVLAGCMVLACHALSG